MPATDKTASAETKKEETQMKKTLAIILSAVMMLCLVPFSAFAAEREIVQPAAGYASYDRDEVYAGNYAGLSYDQIASIILDWLDKEIAANTEDFNSFEIEVFEGTTVEVPLNINSIDGILSYSGYISELGGDFAKLDVSALSGLSRQNGDINLIFGIIDFVSDNAELFGKVFAWEEGKTFDYGKVGEYILALDPAVPENKQIQDFYNNYLIGNDIQEKFMNGIAAEMDYTIAEGETIDDVINNGIINRVAGLCETNGILSADAVNTLKADFNLRTTDIYTLIKNFVALVQEDNQEKIDMYYNYILDTALRTVLKSMFGETPVAGEALTDATAVTAEFVAVYTDLAALYTLCGGTAYFKASDGAYYEFVIAEDGTIVSVKPITWTQQLDINFEPPVVAISTGLNGETLIKEYKPTDPEFSQLLYSTYADQIAAEGFEVAGTTVPETYTALMTDENAAPAMSECFAVKVTQGTETISDITVTFTEIEEMAEAIALEKAKEVAESMVNETITACEVSSVDVTMSYNGWATDDEFIIQITATAAAKVNVTAMGFTVEQDIDASSFITNPVATFVLDDLTGNLEIDGAKELLDFIDTDFVIDNTILDFSGNYDEYNGVIGQVNHIVYALADMLVSDSGMNKLDLTDGDNSNLTANMQKICDTANEMMASAEEVMNDEGLQQMIADFGLNDILSAVNGLKADVLYAIDFSSVEALYVSVIDLALDILDDGENALVAEIHTLIGGLDTLDKMAVAVTDYALDKTVNAVPGVISSLADQFGITVPEYSYSVTKTDTTTVTDNAKTIILEKVADAALYTLTYAFDEVVNAVVNEVIAGANEYLVNDLGEVNFTFGVTKGATGEETLENIADRIIFLANGILIAAGNIADDADVYDKYSALLNAILPMGTILSNCSSENYDCDASLLTDIVFTEVLAGNFDNFLALFEAYNAEDNNKPVDIAYDCSVNYALIKASDYIVDSVFPGTVAAEEYTDSETCQADFTSCDSDVAIAARNMVSINGRKQNIVPAALELIRESDILKSLVTPCPHDNKVETEAVAATCKETGYTAGEYCNDCGKYVSGHEETGVDENAHGSNLQNIPAVNATCTSEGKTAGVKCLDCGNIISGCETQNKLPHSYSETVVAPTCTQAGYTTFTCTCGDSYTGNNVAATGHTDANTDYICDTCGAELDNPNEPAGEGNFFDKIIAFFRSIIDWFKNLFNIA